MSIQSTFIGRVALAATLLSALLVSPSNTIPVAARSAITQAAAPATGQWVVVNSPTTGHLYGMSLLSPSDGYAVGGILYQYAVLLHWDGASWSWLTSTYNYPVYAVSMYSTTQGYAGAEYGRVLSWNGARWSAVPSLPTNNCYFGVAAVSAAEAWMVGCNGQALHRTQSGSTTTWKLEPVHAPFLNEVSAVTSSDVWAVGSSGAIRHWDGSSWSVITSPVTNSLHSVHMISATEGWAVGDQGVILHYSGGDWNAVTSPVTTRLYSVSMLSPTDGWAVGGNGSYYSPADGATLLHWDGQNWSQVVSPVTRTLYAVNMVSPADGWAMGGGGTILRYQVSLDHKVFCPLLARD